VIQISEFCRKCITKYVGTTKEFPQKILDSWWCGKGGLCEGCGKIVENG